MQTIAVIHCDLPEYRVPLFLKLCQNNNYHFIIYNYKKSRKTQDIIEKSKYKNRFHFINTSDNYSRFKSKFYFILEVEKILNKLKSDILMLDSPIYIETILLFILHPHIKKIIWDEEFIGKKTIKRNIIMPITNLINKFSYKLLVPTQGHKNYQINKGVKASIINIFPNVTNILPYQNRLTQNYLVKDYNLGDKKVILYAGRLLKIKGVDYLLHAYQKLITINSNIRDNTVLMIVGEGIEKDNLEKLSLKIKKIGGTVIFTGHIDNNRLAIYYDLSYIGVIPSINLNGRSEAYGLVVNEFLVHLKPVIVTNMVGSESIIRENKSFGIVINEKSTNALASEMENILSESDKQYLLRKKYIYSNIGKYNDIDKCVSVLNKITKEIDELN